MRVRIIPENQIERLNRLMNDSAQLSDLSHEELTKKPSNGGWSVIEVIDHMIVAHAVYRDKVGRALEEKADDVIEFPLKTGGMTSFLVKRFPPKENKIKFKMKTMKRFQPDFEAFEISMEDCQEKVLQYRKDLEELKSWVETYRNTPVSLNKFNSAVGSWVKFNVPEATEFVLCHDERHQLQWKNVLVA